MTDPASLATVDLNLLLRDALRRRGAGEPIEQHLEDAVAEAVPEPLRVEVYGAIYRTIVRCSEELGCDPPDALHTIVVNLDRYHFNLASPDDAVTDDSLLVVDGKLVALGTLPADTRERLRRNILAAPGAGYGSSPIVADTPPPVPQSSTGCMALLMLTFVLLTAAVATLI